MRTAPKVNGVAPNETATQAATKAVDGGPHTLLIVSDICFLREGLSEVLGRDGAFAVVGAAADLAEALTIAYARRPQVILLDTVLPDGLAAARRSTRV